MARKKLITKLCHCIKQVLARNTRKKKNESKAIAICVTSVLHTRGKKLKKFSCKKQKLLTQ
jgi:hypothetical protein